MPGGPREAWVPHAWLSLWSPWSSLDPSLAWKQFRNCHMAVSHLSFVSLSGRDPGRTRGALPDIRTNEKLPKGRKTTGKVLQNQKHLFFASTGNS